MITTVTMNASLDKLYKVRRLRDGTVMRVSEVSNTAGGKGLNVAKVAALLGEKVAATGFVGGFNGAHVRSLLAGTGVEDAFVDSGVETRACINVIDGETGASTEFLEPGPAVAPERYEEFIGRYRTLVAKSDAVTISGSLPSGAPEGFYGRLVAIAREAGVPVILDTSGRLLREGIASCPTLIKPNREELAALTGVEPAGEEEIVEAMCGLLHGGLPSVAVSLGAEGCLFACRDGAFRGSVPDVRAVNTVGCGDSMVAAFAVGMARRMPPTETFRLALAVSAASAMDSKTGSFDKTDFEKLHSRVRTEQMNCPIPQSFTIRLKVDFTGVAADEALYETGPVRLALRMAGHAPELEEYDERRGNYLHFLMPDGSCPVIEATICEQGGRVGLPLGALPHTDGVHDVTLDFSLPRWTICVDGVRDEDWPPDPNAIAWPDRPMRGNALSTRVKEASLSSPSLPDAFPSAPDSRHVARPIQYWTPDDPDAWVGDVALGSWRGRLHVFYLFDRRHHGSGGGAGRHFFAHLSSANLADWDEHPPAVPIENWWETLGTGTPFVHEGRLHLAYGLHTDRLSKDPTLPIGATYASSDDGIHFAKSGRVVHHTQNPTIYNRPDGLLGLAAGYAGTGGLWTSDHIGDWWLHDGEMPMRGDCPCPFEWNGHHYILQGFTGFAHSASGLPGTWEDWGAEGRTPYDGLSVPMVASFGQDRRILAGWLQYMDGLWGGWLVFRELVQEADGTLGTKWVPEIPPPSPPKMLAARPDRPLRIVFPREGDTGPALVFSLEPAARMASFADDVPYAAFSELNSADNIRIHNLPEFDADYTVRIAIYWDAKAGATIFDAEIGGVRTLICRRKGRFKNG